MKNLEQYRAASALQFWNTDSVKRVAGRENLEVAHQLPLLLTAHGLLPTIAFAKANGGLAETILTEVGRFLSSAEVRILPVATQNLDQFISVLTNERSSALLLQRATTEALAYAAYLDRFAPRGSEN
jgi:hypothetical protein